MRLRSGFARLLPLMVLAGLAAGTIALLASALPVQAPPPALHITVNPRGVASGGCGDVSAPVPAFGMVDADGRRWELADLPGRTLRGLDLHGAQWAGVDLHNACFIGCNFRDGDLRCANLRHVAFIDCDMGNTNLDGAHARDCAAWWTKPLPGGSQWTWR